MKMTPQRVAIMDFLDGNQAHPSADDIFSSVRKRFPSMSFATVYNTLERLRGEGQLMEVSIDPARKRYDPDTRPHHHIICSGCGAVADIHREFDLSVPQEERGGFSIDSNHVEFYGLCPKCT
ncbi:MAG: transcriptional repressor [Thermodesulfovibrionales bacterium]|nr:transcriptional repressor [Thermodesulfovibrionales bacterium]